MLFSWVFIKKTAQQDKSGEFQSIMEDHLHKGQYFDYPACPAHLKPPPFVFESVHGAKLGRIDKNSQKQSKGWTVQSNPWTVEL